MFLLSLPMRGAWIEMVDEVLPGDSYKGRSPCGERGLKYFWTRFIFSFLTSLPMRGAWIEIHPDFAESYLHPVAPHAGSVD